MSIIFCNFAAQNCLDMRKIRQYIAFVALVAALVLQSCSWSEHRLQKRQQYAEKRTEALCEALEDHAPLDTIRAIAEKDEDVFFYIFDKQGMVYWSSNRLAADEVMLNRYDKWEDMSFSNAEASARWTKAGMYNVLTVLPTHYTELRQFNDIDSIASKTFSFRHVLNPKLQTQKTSPFSSKLYFYIIIALFVAVILIGIYGLIHYGGIRNMRISTRIMYIIFTCILAVFIYIFVMSIRYVHANYELRQRRGLRTRAEYIQAHLRTLYDVTSAEDLEDEQYLAIDLRDLGYDMNQDIHVYSLSGELIASSSEALFNGGILSRRMSPEALYSQTYPVVCYEHMAGRSYLVVYLPFINGYFNEIGYIAVPYFMSEQIRDAEVDALLQRLLPPYLAVLILALIFSFWAAHSMTAPIHMINEKMKRFEIGGKDNHLDYPYHDELGALVERYNMLVDQVEVSAEQLANAERESAWQTMARQVAHEINNPLTPMKLSVQKMQLKHGSEGFDEYFDKTTKMLIAEIDNLAHIAQSFSTFAKQPEVITSEVDIAEKLSNVVTLQRANDEQIPIRYVGADSGVMVYADNEQVAQVFVNIIRNALQASPTDIIVMLNATYSDTEVQISISDNGSGIPEELQPRIFRPNFTTKSTGNGLGLAISKHIVDATGGHIDFTSSEKGTTFYIYFRKKS